jgi:DNA repair protein RadA/Sms
VKLRAERLGCPEDLWVVGATSLPGIGAALEQVKPQVVVVDSIQTVWDPTSEAAPGSVTQVRSCAGALTLLAKRTGVTVILVGHVTKDGALAGPRTLEHLVDTVLSFEGDRHHALRLLRAVKHRFGPTGELGVFEMAEEGLRGVADASGLFLGDRRCGEPGSAVFPSVEGVRPVLVEIQALVAPGTGGVRRSGIGVDGARLGLLAAVLDRRGRVEVGGADIYASAAGGARVAEPGADLAICLSMASAALDIALPADIVVIGEVGLAGELRQASHTPRRVAEAARLGFRRALLPASSGEVAGLECVRVDTLDEAVTATLGASRGIRPDLRRPQAAAYPAAGYQAAGRS